MKIRYPAWIAMGCLLISSAALAQGNGCKGMDMMGGDAKMTKEAFMKHAEERFARMDANGDGVIDAGEHEKMHEQMQTCMGMMGGKGDKAGAHSGHHPTP